MAVAGSDAINLRNSPPGSHRFNPRIVGRGEVYPNEVQTTDQCIVGIQATLPCQRIWEKPIFFPPIRVTCLISTCTEPTVFQGRIAHSLGLDEPRGRDVVADTIVTAFGPQKRFWHKQSLYLLFGPAPFREDYLPIDVWFPVMAGPKGWEWDCGFPQWNVLGMTGMLNRRMLCLTSERVYAFERL